MKLSLVIPCYNEARNLPLLLERCVALTTRANAEVILVDNGSCDDTPSVLADLLPQSLGCRSVRVETNRGYGFGISSGLGAARGDIVGWTHADMQTDPLDVREGFALFEQAAHPEKLFVKGLRHGRPASDVLFTVSMSLFEIALFGQRMWDIHGQPTLFHRSFLTKWSEPPDDFALDLFAYHAAVRNRLAVRRFPVRFGPRAHGVSHWNVNWAAKAKFIRRTVAYSLRLRRNLPNAPL